MKPSSLWNTISKDQVLKDMNIKIQSILAYLMKVRPPGK
jgi:hypothetical protein